MIRRKKGDFAEEGHRESFVDDIKEVAKRLGEGYVMVNPLFRGPVLLGKPGTLISQGLYNTWRMNVEKSPGKYTTEEVKQVGSPAKRKK